MSLGLIDCTRALACGSGRSGRAVSAVQADPALSALLEHHQLTLPYLQAHPGATSQHLLRSFFRREGRMQRAKRLLAERLTSNGVPFCWVKGTPLAEKLFGAGLTRYSGDVDILVQPADFKKACTLLLEAGCRLPAEAGRMASDIIADGSDGVGRWRKDALLISPEGVKLEVHHRLAISPGPVHRAYEEWLWSQREGGAGEQSALSVVELFYLICHGSDTAFHRLKWLRDIATYLEKLQARDGALSDDFAADLILQAEGFQIMRRVLVAWALSHHYFCTGLPDAVQARLAKDRLARWLVNQTIAYAEVPSEMAGWRYRFIRRASSVLLEQHVPRRASLCWEYLRNVSRNRVSQ